jgi:regulator of protease activity HflC (stomatin/prohibitin superfamily)
LLIILAVIVLAALKMARQWEQAVVLRADKFLAVRGPGLFWIIPVLDTVAAMIDTRLRTTQFVAEQTLNKDTVPVDVDAIIFWMVTDVRRAALEVASYEKAISWAAQTTLREMIGAADLAMLLSNRKRWTRSCARQSMRRPRNGGSSSSQSRFAMSRSRPHCRMR